MRVRADARGKAKVSVDDAMIATLLGAVVCSFGTQTDGVTREQFARIKPGMYRQEVEAILGPARDRCSGGRLRGGTL
jgi:hypothetical protein